MRTFKILVATMVLGLALTGRANASTTFEAPYADMTHDGSCLNWSNVLPTPQCASHATADAASGRIVLDASLPEGPTTPMQASSLATGAVRIDLNLDHPADSIPFTVVAHVNRADTRIAAAVPGGVDSASSVELTADLSFGFSSPTGGGGETLSEGYMIASTDTVYGGVPHTEHAEDVDIVFTSTFQRLGAQFESGSYDVAFGANGGITCGTVVPDLCSGGATADVVIKSISIG